jgi:glycogen(starch) synthase
MRVLLCSYWFSPSIGGIETVSKILAEEFGRAGATVTVVTDTTGPSADGQYSIARRPSLAALIRLGRRSDIILQNNISLRMLIPLLFTGRPIVITHQSWLARPDGKKGWENHLKLFLLRRCHNVSISTAIAAALPLRSLVIGNPFDAAEFEAQETYRERDIVFMGRLVSDKGCDLLLHSLAELRDMGISASLSIIGEGPELPTLRSLVESLDLLDQVTFLGAKREGRGAIVARHRILVIPSRWAEPFGVVALEGIASGCAIVASSQGGLMEAVGKCGIFFTNGDVASLTLSLKQVLGEEVLLKRLLSNRLDHIKQFGAQVIAHQYLCLFQDILSKGSSC